MIQVNNINRQVVVLEHNCASVEKKSALPSGVGRRGEGDRRLFLHLVTLKDLFLGRLYYF